MSDSIWICKWRLVREHSVIFYPRRENVINHMNKAQYQSNVLQRAGSTVELLAGQENMLNLASNWIRYSKMIPQYSLRQEQNVCSTYLAIAVMRDQIMIDLQHSQILSSRKQCTLFWVILKTFEVINLLLNPASLIHISFHVSLASKATRPYQRRPLMYFTTGLHSFWIPPKWFSCEGSTYISFAVDRLVCGCVTGSWMEQQKAKT